MTKNPKGGRPPKPARLKRTKRLQLLLTGAEYTALNEFARRRNLTASEVVRGCLQSVLTEQATASVKKGANQ